MKQRCTECDVELTADALYCHLCGRAVASPAGDDRETSEVLGAKLRRRRRQRAWRPGVSLDDDAERELWRDTFSAKALFPYWVLAIVCSVLLPIASRWLQLEPPAGSVILAGISLLWAGLLGWIVYLKLDVHYVLTNQRFVHQSGILTRQTRRIEVIDIDDVSYRQSIIDRLTGVGTIEIVSSDRSDPIFVLYGIDRVREVAERIDEARRAERIRRGLHIESV